ncbi:MAG: hypothetical protein IT456_10600 [Planctomycetes bacterium]|nr:hypothetical protein [Planctomycetota bacterium]
MATIRVEATQVGFYNGHRVRPGEVITIEEKQFSSKWMKRTDASPTKKIPVKPLKGAKEGTLSVGGKNPPGSDKL